ncbi:MAG: Glu/Leu/Phe/Val dehydrogenase [Alphaproteobacteria bacterium]|nr:Glu/Leu/Phe/Val dehydrogenase [Alphaproteobacteria bacterium]NCQ89271.1 Glu/Leu/Phe/Val dehydrogenase [Alphaproteobacteria bacterium]NCT08134.1 Glu/Leu/Phe/Val dehydrogenase [Alphaproteobacteria bacterium]
MTNIPAFTDLSDENLARFDSFDEHETVRRFDLGQGVIAFVAVHNTNLGPGLGGCRMRAYGSEDEAINDVLRLSRGMTYKNAMAGLPLGGGKSVLIGDPATQKNKELMEAMGRAVETLEGSYITAEDSGTGEQDMVAMATQTDFVTGLPPEKYEDAEYGELGGNPSPVTALGCYHGILAAIKHRYGDQKKLSELTVSVQGVGAVGLALCELLQQDGAKLIVTDISDEGLAHAQNVLGDVTVVHPDEIYGVEADIFAPCAMGGILNDHTIVQLKVDIIAGASNNQLLAPHHDNMIAAKGITYVPDYVINAGGVICVGYEFFRNSGYNPMDFQFTRRAMLNHVERIGQTVSDILKRAQETGMNTGEAADALAEEKFIEGGALDDNSADSNAADQSSFGTNDDMTLVQ